MSLLTPQDRAYILEQLTLAPDSVLADAMLAFNAIRDKIVEVRQLCNAVTPTKESFLEGVVAYERELVEKNMLRKNVSPGAVLIGKIGGNTKDVIFEFLRDDKQPPAKYGDHLKLLWSRGEVKFDGKEYYL